MTSPDRPRKWNRKRIVPLAATALIVLTVLVALGVVVGQSLLISKVGTLSGALPTSSNRPDPDGKAQTILLLGSDKRDESARDKVEGERSDTLMVVRVAGDRRSVSVVSIPRDSWVEIPGHGNAKINAAFSLGGTALAVETVEKLGDVRVDHVVVIDWEGFERLTDMFGGVTVKIPETTYDAYRKKTWKKGTHHLDGAEALLYVRQRSGLPNGDLDRVKRQQNVIRILMSEFLSKRTLANPVKLYKALNAIIENLEVDEEFTSGEMRSLAYSMRSLKAKDVRFTTIPVSGLGTEGAQSVVRIDRAKAKKMWKAFDRDCVAQWVDEEKLGLETTVK